MIKELNFEDTGDRKQVKQARMTCKSYFTVFGTKKSKNKTTSDCYNNILNVYPDMDYSSVYGVIDAYLENKTGEQNV
ncbi:hypothetical protein EPNKCIFM_00197 [Klebsiella phage KP13-16]|nr:hypothetical protein EPNKCIFM_00197 [Klebsiella phage KP13-16]